MRIPHLAALLIFVRTICAAASVVEYNDRNAWLTTTGVYTHITFQGFSNNTIITNQYSDLGVTFTDGTDRISVNAGSFPNDGVGLYGAVDTIHLAFLEQRQSIAVDFPGAIQFRLYRDGALIYTSAVGGIGGAGFFKGLISDQPFDEVTILDPLGGVYIDDLYFGGAVPAPGGLALLALMALPTRRRRGEGR